MSKINWKVRFNAKNKAFIARVFVAVLVPILVYYGLEVKDLTSWDAVFNLVVKAISNPFVIGTAVVNFINILPDPTTAGFSDSNRALGYEEPHGENTEKQTETEKGE